MPTLTLASILRPRFKAEAEAKAEAHTAEARPSPITLAPGVTTLHWLERGTVLHIHQGALTLEEAPRGWAGWAWPQPARTLPRGAVWIAPRGTWARFTAGPDRGCTLSARPPAAPRSRRPPRC